jgi:hypothetical protein
MNVGARDRSGHVRPQFAMHILDHLDHAGVAAERTGSFGCNARSSHAPDVDQLTRLLVDFGNAGLFTYALGGSPPRLRGFWGSAMSFGATGAF